jgi:hypothetical protein
MAAFGGAGVTFGGKMRAMRALIDNVDMMCPQAEATFDAARGISVN